ncbi:MULTISPECIES: family 20 glycosylhydrolase [unclassified Actinomyces]|uniref:family 20 glycosylhydrolase n=1 Tax=unclassified Actinomyces TaxID=2609248 RepID=UPI0032D5840C
MDARASVRPPAQSPTVQGAWEIRALHLDIARKRLGASWIHARLAEMDRAGLNELQLHVSDNEGYGIVSAAHPEIVSEGALSAEELKGITADAHARGIRIVPALDIPGHFGHVLARTSGLAASDTVEGRRVVDYSRSEARDLMLDLVDELDSLLPGIAWHLGGDEVFDIAADGDVEQRFPQLAAYAVERCGEGALVHDGYVALLNDVARHLCSRGRTDIRAWNDALYLPGTRTALDPRITVCYWTDWHPSYPTLERIRQAGHRVINYCDRPLYYVLARAGEGHAYEQRPTAESVSGWRPGLFPAAHDGSAQRVDEGAWWLRGASLAVWCDHPDAEDGQTLAAGLAGPLQAFGDVMSTGRMTGPAHGMK